MAPAETTPAETMTAADKFDAAQESPAVARAKFTSENVYFDFDSAALKSASIDVLSRKAKWLADNPNETVTIEGHCDERGTTEYNMALGEARAKSAASYLKQAGIAADRMSTVSFGEEKPAVIGSNESAWAQNRRAQFELE